MNFFGLSSTAVIIVGICAALSTGLLWFHHAAVKGEDQKIALHTAAVISTVQEKKNAIRSHGYSDNLSIKRLQRGTF